MTNESRIILADKRTIRKAVMDDLPLVMKLIQQGREKMIASGNPNQWSAAHPSRKKITQDIVQGDSYLLCEDGLPVATFAFLPGPDPTYSYIEGGHWLDDSPYYVSHRVASMDGVHGIMADIIAYCSSVAHALRIDTHADNRPMQKALSRLGFAYCGVIYLQSGDSRMAFQKITSAL